MIKIAFFEAKLFNPLLTKIEMCKECETKPVYEFTNKIKLCKGCFIHWFNKKFLYTLRKFGMIENGDVLCFANKHTFREAVLEELLKGFEKSSSCKVIINGKCNKLVVSNSLDIETRKIVDSLFEGKGFSVNFSPVIKGSKIVIKPLYLFLDKEIMLYAKLKNLKFKETKEDLNQFELLIEDLEKKHPEIKQAIIQSYLKIKD